MDVGRTSEREEVRLKEIGVQVVVAVFVKTLQRSVWGTSVFEEWIQDVPVSVR